VCDCSFVCGIVCECFQGCNKDADYSNKNSLKNILCFKNQYIHKLSLTIRYFYSFLLFCLFCIQTKCIIWMFVLYTIRAAQRSRKVPRILIRFFEPHITNQNHTKHTKTLFTYMLCVQSNIFQTTFYRM